MADDNVVQLVIGVDEGTSVDEFEKGVRKVIADVEAKGATKIKLSVDDSSISEIKSKLESITNIMNSSNSSGLVSGAKEADNAYSQLDSTVKNAANHILETAKESQNFDNSGIQKASELMQQMGVNADRTQIQVRGIGTEQQQVIRLVQQGTDAANNQAQAVTFLDQKTGNLVQGYIQLNVIEEKVLDASRPEQYNKYLGQITNEINRVNAELEKWNSLEGTDKYKDYQEYANQLENLKTKLENAELTDRQYREELANLQMKYRDVAQSLKEQNAELEKETAAAEAAQKAENQKADAIAKTNEKIREANTNLQQWEQYAASMPEYEQYKKLTDDLDKLNTKYQETDMSQQEYTAQSKKLNAAMSESAKRISEYVGQKKQEEAADSELASRKQQEASAEKQYMNILSQSQSFLTRYTAAKHSHNSASRDAYSAVEQEITALKNLYTEYKTTDMTVEEFRTRLTKMSTELKEHTVLLQQNGDATKSWGDRLQGLMTKFSSWLSASSIIMYSIQAMRKLVNASIEVEDAMAQIQIVTGATDTQMKAFFTETTELAQELGQSISDVAGAIETFARLGYSFSESSNLAEYATILANVGNTDVESATTGITSILKGYDLLASDAEHITDVLISVGQNYAISAEELFEAFERGGAALAATGATVEESAGLFAATNAALQNASATGTLWKTVSARIRGSKTELEELGEDAEECANGISKYRNEVQALTGVDIMIDDSTYKSIYDIFTELAGVWDGLTDTVQARVSEILGGTRQLSGISSTINNIADAMGAYDVAMNSAGTATAANDIYLETTTAHLNQLSATFQEFGYDLFDSSMMQFFIDLLKDIISAVDTLIDTFGTFGTISIVTFVAGLTSAMKSLNAVKDSIAAVTTAVGTSDMATLFSDVSGVYKYTAALKEVDASQQNAVMSAMGLTNAQKEQVAAMQKLLTSTDEVKISTIAEAAGCEASTIANAAKKDSTESLTVSELLQAMQQDENIQLTYDQITALYQLQTAEKTGEKTNLSFGQSLKAMFSSNPVGMIMMIVSALVTLFSTLANNTDLFKSLDEKIEDLEDDLNTLQETASNAADDFNSLSDSLNLNSDKSLIDEYAELSQGVDALGQNVNLTSDDYDRFVEIQNTLANLFPEIDGGLDSNGNHMLKLSADTDTAVDSLNDLVEKEREAANTEIADTIPDMLEDIQKLTDAYEQQISNIQSYMNTQFNESSGGYKVISGEIKEAYDILKDMGGDNGLISLSSSVSDMSILSAYEDAFKELGATVTQTIDEMGQISYEISFDQDKIDAQFDNLTAGTIKDVDNYEKRIKAQWESLSSSFISLASLDPIYQEMDEAGQGMVNAFINGMDFDTLLSDESINTAEDIENYIISNIIDPISSCSEEVTDAWNELIQIKPDTSDLSFKELKGTIEEYAELVAEGIGQPVEDVISSLYSDSLDEYNDKLTAIKKNFIDSSTMMEKYGANAAQRETEAFNDWIASLEVQDYKSWAESLTATEVNAAYTLMMSTDTTNWDLDKWMEEVQNLQDMDNVLTYEFDLEVESEGLDAVNTALSETTKATGLQSDTIDALKDRYKDLDDYNAGELFERTSWGVRINTDRLKELETEYENFQKDSLQAELDGLAQQYNNLSVQIGHCKEGSKEYNELMAQRDEIEDKIDDVATLASQYGALTSEYQQWQDALSAGAQRDTMESIASGYQDMADILARGWTNDSSLNEYLDLLLNANQRTEDTAADFEKLTQTIEGTGHSIMDYFTVDESGNLTTTGLFDFLDDVNSKLGDEFVWIDENENYMIDFTNGKMDQVAEAFGMSTEAVNWFIEALKDVDGAVVSEDILDTMKLYDGSIEDSIESLKDLAETNKQLSEVFDQDYEFGVTYSSENVDKLNEDIEEAKRLCQGIDLSVDTEGAEEAYELLYGLLVEKENLETPTVLEIDSSSLETTTSLFDGTYDRLETWADTFSADAQQACGDIQNLYLNLEDFQIALEMQDAGIDVDTSEAEQNIKTLIDDLGTLSQDELEEILIQLGLYDYDARTDFEQLIQELSGMDAADVDLKLRDGVDEELMEKINAIHGDMVIGDNADEEETKLDELDEYEIGDKTIGVSVPSYDHVYLQLESLRTELNNINGMRAVATVEINQQGSTDVAGTANAHGTAKDSGDWSVGYDGISLGGELGPELVVSDGKWYTIGDDSAEFFHHKPGDIIFNADQTEQIFKYGKIVSGDKRGTSFAEGTAFATGASGKTKRPTVTVSDSSVASSKSNDEETTTTTTTTTTSPASSPSSTSTTTSTSNNTSSNTDEEPSTEIIDWIEIAIDRIERSIDNFAKIAKSSYKDLGDKLSAANSEISQVNYEMQVQQQAYNRYMQQANSVGLSSGLKQQVQNGSINITEYDEETGKLIEEYQKWSFVRNAVKSGNRFKHYLFNCWDTLKIVIPQRKDEIYLSVTVTKVEKNNYMRYGVNLSLI